MRKPVSFLPVTDVEVCKKKRLFMRLLQGQLDPLQRLEYEKAVNHCDKITARITEKAKRMGLLIILLGLLLISGCTAGAGIGLDGSLFYPNIPGKLKDPAESRNQTTQHTTSMARNNLPMVGGSE